MHILKHAHTHTYREVFPNYAGEYGGWISVRSEIMSYEMYKCVFRVVNDDHVCTVCNNATSHIYFVLHWAERDSGVHVICFVPDLRKTCSTRKQQNILSLLASELSENIFHNVIGYRKWAWEKKQRYISYIGQRKGRHYSELYIYICIHVEKALPLKMKPTSMQYIPQGTL